MFPLCYDTFFAFYLILLYREQLVWMEGGLGTLFITSCSPFANRKQNKFSWWLTDKQLVYFISLNTSSPQLRKTWVRMTGNLRKRKRTYRRRIGRTRKRRRRRRMKLLKKKRRSWTRARMKNLQQHRERWDEPNEEQPWQMASMATQRWRACFVPTGLAKVTLVWWKCDFRFMTWVESEDSCWLLILSVMLSGKSNLHLSFRLFEDFHIKIILGLKL